jgi:zinc transport system ATP-binding protein
MSDKKLADEAMARMGIENLAGKCYRELSGGQQQRVLLARAYCATGKLILLDEPIAGLDPMAMTEMYSMIADLNREGVAVVMVSHDVSAAVNYATHILHMSKTTAFFGTTEEYLATPVGQQFARRERGSYGDWSPKTAWDAPDIGRILDVRATPDARSVLGARGVSLNRDLTAARRRVGSDAKTQSRGEGQE